MTSLVDAFKFCMCSDKVAPFTFANQCTAASVMPWHGFTLFEWFIIETGYVSVNVDLLLLICSAAERGSHFDVMLIEKWPLIQAFALDGFGGSALLINS